MDYIIDEPVYFDALNRVEVFGDSGGAQLGDQKFTHTLETLIGVDEGHHHRVLHGLGSLHGGVRVSVFGVWNILVDCVTCQEKVGPSRVFLMTGLEQLFRNWG
jgi:hypothetical protein